MLDIVRNIFFKETYCCLELVSSEFSRRDVYTSLVIKRVVMQT